MSDVYVVGVDMIKFGVSQTRRSHSLARKRR